MSENPLRRLHAVGGDAEITPENGPKKIQSVPVIQLEEGDYSVGHGKRIQRIVSMRDGRICIIFEKTTQEEKERREGTTVFLDRGDVLDITRGS